MSRKYTPRRASKRWLEGAPSYILDVIWERGPNATADCITVLLTGDELIRPEGSLEYTDCRVPYIGLDVCGRGCWGELSAYEAAGFRYRRKHHRATWASLPEIVRREVIYRVEDTEA